MACADKNPAKSRTRDYKPSKKKVGSKSSKMKSGKGKKNPY